jgi:hypothetical protein
MDKKKSIINIQNLGLLVASRHSTGGQPILRVVYRKNYIFRNFLLFRKEIFYFFKSILKIEIFLGYRRAADTLNESPKVSKSPEISILSIIS